MKISCPSSYKSYSRLGQEIDYHDSSQREILYLTLFTKETFIELPTICQAPHQAIFKIVT